MKNNPNLVFYSFKSLFEKKKLIIPPFQRDYIWSKENWKIWLEDVRKLICNKDEGDAHFIGSVICKKTSKVSPNLTPEFLIIDGQQRITTFFIFSFVILELLEKKNSKNNQIIQLIGNIKDDLFFSDKREPRLIIRGENKNSLEAITRHKNQKNNEERIFKAYQWFKKALGSNMNERHLKDYSDILRSNFGFIFIELEEKEDALEVFKSMNTSGKVLTSIDLIKAEFFIAYEEKGLDWEKLAQEWEDMKKRVGEGNLNHFFYVFLLTKYQKLKYSERDFYSYFRDRIRDSLKKDEIEELWDEIVEKSEIYSQILNPQQDYWGENFYLPILENKILDSKIFYPLIIALKCKGLQGRKEAAIFKKLIVYYFRRKIKGIFLQQQNEALKWVSSIQNDQLESILNDPKIIKEIEKSSIFWDELEHKSNLKESEIKWLLNKLYSTYSPEGFYPSLRLQLEHMFPKNPDAEWWDIQEWKDLKEDEKQKKEKLHSLGNSTLLTSNKNILANNKTWEKKKKEYRKKTCLQYEKNELNLLEKSVLLPKDIDERKKWLIKSFKETGILFIDEEKERDQIEKS
jgi:uncharacterized protein with ParB-like and HNH nuclease domain